MRRLLFFFVAAFGFLIAIQAAQAQTDANNISTLLKSGNVDQLSTYFNNSVDIILPDDEDTYSKATAVDKVKKFFSTHTPTAFAVKHQGKSEDGSASKYVIGTLTTATGSYRTYFVIRDGKIPELSIEK